MLVRAVTGKGLALKSTECEGCGRNGEVCLIGGGNVSGSLGGFHLPSLVVD